MDSQIGYALMGRIRASTPSYNSSKVAAGGGADVNAEGSQITSESDS
jgi:hypothetical protein